MFESSALAKEVISTGNFGPRTVMGLPKRSQVPPVRLNVDAVLRVHSLCAYYYQISNRFQHRVLTFPKDP